jgi:(1->4)-alpha-D-glucan 1-alpha-D-glucosylmutase
MNVSDFRPIATYRLQFNQDFRFADAQSLVPYFSRLGVTHVYASPILRARHASTHGYDVVDPKTINPDLGDKTILINLVTDLRKFGLGLILDVVPNHMAASIENPYWRDVLTYGPSSPFARWFDIKWRMPDPDMWGRVLVPVLGEPRARVLENDQLQLVWSDGRFLVKYFEHVFPVDPSTVPEICQFGLDDLKASLTGDHPALAKIAEILARLKKLPKLAGRLRRQVKIDRDETEQWLAEFAQLVVQSPRIEQWAEQTAERFGQGDDGRRRLKKFLDSQPYRLVHWRDAARTINYRRFFDINELISIRQEDPQVFEETHATVLRWVDDGLIDGLRVDHIDGLRDPLGYLQRLAKALPAVARIGGPVPVFVEKILAAGEELPSSWPVAGTTGYEFLNELEAIFISPEGFAEIERHYRDMLRRPVKFEQVATRGKRRILRNDLSPQVGRLADTLLRLATTSKHSPPSAVKDAEFALATASPDGESLGVTDSASATLLAHHEPTRRDFADAIVEVITALPVYRTYVDSNSCTVNDADRRYVETALHAARESGRVAPEAIDFLGEVLLLINDGGLPQHELYERVNFVQRFQQLSGPAAAKGIEDTALYIYVPLVSLNEVGGEPWHANDQSSIESGDSAPSPVNTASRVDRLHESNIERVGTHPQSMLCVTTHDTKRTADVRARLDVLSEIPQLWSELARRWHRLNRPHQSRVGGGRAPDAETEYLIYQTVVGIWPAPAVGRSDQLPTLETLKELSARVEQYMLKAVREAKTHTSWTNNNQPYEDAVASFIRSLFMPDGVGDSRFLADVQNLVARIARPGFWNSIARTLVQFTAPGTPDLYQGDELWNFALVDPDNRRPVDYETRQILLDEIITGVEADDDARRVLIRNLVKSPEDGCIKLHVVRSALAARREHPELFSCGQYIPLAADGPAKNHLFAFARVAHKQVNSSASSSPATNDQPPHAAIVVVPRLTTTLVSESALAPLGAEAWSDTVIQLPDQLSDRKWTCALTREQLQSSADGKLSVPDALRSFPVALLLSDVRPPVAL